MLLTRTGVAIVAVVAAGCGGFVGELYVSRGARLIGQIESATGRVGVPCTVTARGFEHDAEATAPSGGEFTLTVSMGTPLHLPAEFRPRIALRVGCEGHRTVTTAERSVELGWLSSPATSFGRISIPVDN